MNILLIGATGGTGRAILEQALEQGHRVTALARRPDKIATKHELLNVVGGDVLDLPSLENVMPGQLTNGRKRGTYRHGSGIGNWLWTVKISHADVAHFMLKQLTDDTCLRKSPAVAN